MSLGYCLRGISHILPMFACFFHVLRFSLISQKYARCYSKLPLSVNECVSIWVYMHGSIQWTGSPSRLCFPFRVYSHLTLDSSSTTSLITITQLLNINGIMNDTIQMTVSLRESHMLALLYGYTVTLVSWLSTSFSHLYMGLIWIGFRALPNGPTMAALEVQRLKPLTFWPGSQHLNHWAPTPSSVL